MSKVTAKEIAKTIVQSFDVTSCKQLDECLEEAIRSLNPSLGKWLVYDQAEKYKNSVEKYINDYIQKTMKKGIPPRVSWSSSYSERLIGRGFAHRSASPEQKRQKKLLALMDDLQREITQLSADQFEILCCGLLSNMGCENVKRTRRTRDQGIDSFAILRLKETLRGVVLKVIGEAKRYSQHRKISEWKLRNFYGSLKMLERKDRRLEGILPHEFLDLEYDVHGYFFTTSGFSSDAEKFAEASAHKITTLDGEMIAYEMTRFSIGIVEDEQGLIFSRNIIFKQIEEMRAKFPIGSPSP